MLYAFRQLRIPHEKRGKDWKMVEDERGKRQGILSDFGIANVPEKRKAKETVMETVSTDWTIPAMFKRMKETHDEAFKSS